MARSIRFFPPFSLNQRSQEIIPVVVVASSTWKAAPDTYGKPETEPSIDLSEHTTALVNEAVCKPTVLPVTYSIPEDIGDRISRLTQPKLVTAVIIAPKIPQPDFSETSASGKADLNSSGIDPSEHTASLVHEAVSRPTVLPDAYKIPEDIGDRISRLSSPQVAEINNLVDETALEASVPAPEILEAPAVEQTDSDDSVEGMASALDVEQTADKPIETTVVAEPVTTPEPTDEKISESGVPIAEVEEAQQPTILEKLSSVIEAVVKAVQHPEVEHKDAVEEANEAEEPTILAEAEDSSVNEAAATVVEHPETELQDSEPVAEPTTTETVVVDAVEPLTDDPPTQPAPVKEKKASDIQTVEITCPKCESTHIRKNGRRQGKQRYACKDCGREFIASDSAELEDKPKREESSSTVEASSLTTSKPNPASSPGNSASAKSRGKKKTKPKGFGSSTAN